mgnify:CR=1 FL=1
MRIQNAKNYGVTQKEIGAGSTGICTLLCVMLKNTKHIIMYEKNKNVSNLLISIIPMFLLRIGQSKFSVRMI